MTVFSKRLRTSSSRSLSIFRSKRRCAVEMLECRSLLAVGPLAVSVLPIVGTEGVAIASAPIATFIDESGSLLPIADFSATISIVNSAGTTVVGPIAAASITQNGTGTSQYTVAAPSFTLPEEGSYQVSVAVTDIGPPPLTARGAGLAVVSDAPLTAGAAVNLTTNSGALLSSTVVGSFTDANLTAPLSDFKAVIDWGDGSPTSIGTITQPGGVGTPFNIEGTHAYGTPGTYHTLINVTDVGGSAVTVTGTATVTDLAVTGAVKNFTAVEGENTGTIVLATFTDPNPLATTSSVTAALPVGGWGDGSPIGTVPLAVTQIGANATSTLFEVTGSHVYSDEGSFTVNISVTTSGGVTTTLTSGTATVLDAPLTSSNGTTIKGAEGSTTGSALIGTFTDANQGATVADFTTGTGSVVVNWGDGSAPQTLTAANLTPSGTPDGVIFSINAAHAYAGEGQYPITITVTDKGGSSLIISSTALIAGAPLTVSPVQPPVDTIEAGVFPVPQFGAPAFTGAVAAFTSADTTAPLSDFTATIDWGDGTPPSAGTISQPGGVGTAFTVSGSHTYADAGVNGGTGTYPIQVFIASVGGATVTVDNTAHVADRPIVLTGQLNPASDSGVSNTDDITNVKQPDFFGTSEAFSHVTLFETPTAGGSPVQIGQTQALGNGSWNIVSGVPLADGSYIITATAVDQFGVTTTTAPTVITPDLVIDTVGPVITNTVWNRLNGQVDYVIQVPNPASGVDVATLLDSSNYLFTKVHANKAYPGKWIVTKVTATPGAAPDSIDVAVTFDNGKPIRGGFYLFTIRGSSNGNSSVQDIAGNHLDGVFYGSFPSGNGIPGSDFVAELDGYHDKIFAPQTIVGTANAANGGNGGPPVGAVHSGDSSPVVPAGESPILAKRREAAAKEAAKKEAARKEAVDRKASLKIRRVANQLKTTSADHPGGPMHK